jgi:CRP-like cAMP-binding protein
MENNKALRGNLAFLNLADILQLLGSNGATGTLRIKGRYAQNPGFVYIEKGNPLNASNGNLAGLEALNSLFGWTEGEFDFLSAPVQVERTIKKSRMQIILDGIRMLDDGLIEKAGPVAFEKKDASDLPKAGSGPIVKGPLIDYMYVVDEEEFENGEEIVIEGKHGSWIWVVLEGVVQIVKETSQGSIDILRISDGAFIGSIASFLMGGNIRSATTVAIGKVQLGVLDSQRLFVEFTRMSPELRGLLVGLDKRLKQTTDKSVDIFLKRDRPLDTTTGKPPLIKQGDSEERLLKISAGQAFVTRNTESGEILLCELGSGDFVGPVPFANAGMEPDSASVYVSDNIELSPLNPERLQREYEKLSTTFKNIVENLAASISVTTMVAEQFKKDQNSRNQKH